MAQRLLRSPRIDARFTPYKLAIRRSKIHRWGVYAEERIAPRRKVIEYTGQRISRREAKRRDHPQYTYLFAVDKFWTVHGSVGGSGAEIINHSCQPNLVSRVYKGHIVYMSLRAILPDEELTVDYSFPKTVRPMQQCACGAPSCRGTMNLK